MACIAALLAERTGRPVKLRLDRDDDIRMGAKSTAILFGDLDLVIQGILYALFLGTMALVGLRAGLGFYYGLGVGVAAGHAMRASITVVIIVNMLLTMAFWSVEAGARFGG